MKTQIKNLGLALLLTVSSVATVSAQEVKGGGLGTRVNGQLQMMDLVEGLARNSRCEWRSMRELFDSHPKYREFVNGLNPIHSYLVQAFENEASRISVCFAG